MPEPGATSSRDYARPLPSEQAGEHAQPWNGRYDAEREPDAPGTAVNQVPAFAQNPSLSYPDFGAQPAPGQFAGYSFSPGASTAWDWTQSVDFADFTAHYEPQGELVQEVQDPNAASNDFSIPLPVNPLSPPRRPLLQDPVAQTGMKRKAGSEPNSAVSQTASEQQNPPKRAAVSRGSSTASLASPVITEGHPLPMAQKNAGQSTVESAPQSNAQGNGDAQRRRDASKGTGPQGRIIDVSKPRKVAESPSGADILPAGKVFPIQIGSALFRLSGASLSSDGMLL
jgi:hypothetical protein